MANGRPSSSGVFIGIVLITIAALFLLHNYTGCGRGQVLPRSWQLILLFWGLIKLVERVAAHREGRAVGWIIPGEVFLVIAMLVLVGGCVAWDVVRTHVNLPDIGNAY